MALAGLSAASFSTGDWAHAARSLGGPGWSASRSGLAVVAGGCITGVGMFNALSMSYTRLPMAMAEDGLLPRVLARRNRRGVPWVSVLFCGVAWALALKLPFERLISIDLILYGSSLLLEFVALAVLRIREPAARAPLQSRQLRLRLPAGRWSGRADRLCALCLARRKDHWHNLGLLFAVAVGLLGPAVLRAATARRRTKQLAADEGRSRFAARIARIRFSTGRL